MISRARRTELDSTSRLRSNTSKTNRNIELCPPGDFGDRSRSSAYLYDAIRQSCSSPEYGLRHTRNEQHINDERDENHHARDEVCKPHLHGIVAIEGLLNKCVHEAGPNEDERACHRPDHRETKEHVEEVKEL